MDNIMWSHETSVAGRSGNRKECSKCAPRKQRDDLAPSPIRYTGGYSFFGTVSELQDNGCRRCIVLASAVLHFASMFRAADAVKPDNISVECDSLANPSDLFEEAGSRLALGLKRPPVPLFPAELGVCFRFKDMPESGKIELHCVTSPDALKIRDDSETQALNTIKTWLMKCSAEHGSHCAPMPEACPPSRLLYINQGMVRLLDLTRNSRGSQESMAYIALSHCWGNEASNIRTTSANMQDMLGGISIADLPLTFRDAIKVTLRLGYHLIWIDSLCIIQDDKVDWERESACMADIYKNAVLTVAATRSPDGHGGCFFSVYETPYIWRRMRNYGSDDDTEEPVLVKHADLWRPYKEERDGFSRWFALRPGHDIRDLSHKGNYGENSKDVVEKGYPLLSRAWFFQERLLSSRLIHFGHMELAWECHMAFWSQSLWTEFRRDDVGRQGPQIVTYPIEKTRRILRSFLNGPTLEHSALARQTGQIDPQKLWKLLVEEYSRLKVSRETDRLPALSGIAVTVADFLLDQLKADNCHPNTYIAGLWSKSLPAALYWTCSPASYRPRCYRAPTFSWASVEGPITYHEAATNDAGYGRYVCELMRFSSFIEGLDPHGKVTAGYIEIYSHAGMASVRSLCEESGGGKLTVCVVEQYDNRVEGQTCQPRRQAFHTDISLRSSGINTLETRVGDEVLLLLLECVKQPMSGRQPANLKVLVLKSSQTVSGAYDRLGLIQTETSIFYRWNTFGGDEIENGDMFYDPGAWFPKKMVVKIV